MRHILLQLCSLAIFVTLFLAPVQVAFADSGNTEKIKIGVSIPLTGNAATYGVDMKNALLFANEYLTGNKYELIIEDDKCDAREAVNVANRFVNVNHIKYILGGACSGAVLAAAPVYERAKVILIASGSSAAGIADAGEYIFRTTLSDEHAARKLYEYVSTKHKRFGIFTEETEYSKSFLESFKQENKDNKVDVFEDNFLTNSTDFRSSLLKLRAKNLEGLFINTQTELTFLAVLKQIKELKWEIPLYSAYWAGSPSLLDKAKEMSEGIVYVDLPTIDEVATTEGKELFAKYCNQFGKPKSIELLFATSLEAFRAIDLAIQSGENPHTFLNQLHLQQTKFNGLFGQWTFDKKGEIQSLSFVLKIVRNGKGELMKH